MVKLSLDEKCFQGDRDFLKKNVLKVERLILKNPFSERMRFLLEHQELARTPVLNLAGELKVPECKGTAFWIAGVSKLDYPYQANEDELNPHMKVEGEDWEDDFCVHNKRKIPGAFVFSYSAEADNWHAGIYLGEIKSIDIFFAKHGTCGLFSVETSRCYASPAYYIPRTLKKSLD